MERKEFRVKQDILFVAVPLIFDFLFLIVAHFLSSPWRWILAALALIFAGIVIWQFRPFLKSFELLLTQKGIKVKDFRGNTVREVEWKKVEAAAAGFRKTWLIYTYSFYFRIKGDEDVLFGLVSREPGLTAKFQQFMKVFVRKKIPVQVVKS